MTELEMAEALVGGRLAAERFGVAVRQLQQRLNDALRPMVAAWAAARRAEIAECQASLIRPDGRPRRSGHRHRGTPAWGSLHGRRIPL